MEGNQCLFVVLLAIFIVQSAVGQFRGPADVCNSDACDINNNCRCSSQDSPIVDGLDEWPQLVSLTFDDAVTQDVYKNYWSDLLLARINPDSRPIGGTFFVPHEYTNYKLVNDLYNYGFEIGVHSITKYPLQDYWRYASEDTLFQEFQGQKHIISKFANIPEEAIQAVRTPQFQLAGNTSIKAYISSGLKYDSSWPSLPTNRLFPYTLDYQSTQQCLLGAQCPNEGFPGFWILPINELTGYNGKPCNSLASCRINGTAKEIGDWLFKQIDTTRNTTKTPMTLVVDSYWFNFTENSLEGFTRFLDRLKDRPDVFLVSQKQIYDFIRAPKRLSEFKTDDPPEQEQCIQQSCTLKKGKDDRNLVGCIPCPDVYPWLGNPDGSKPSDDLGTVE